MRKVIAVLVLIVLNSSALAQVCEQKPVNAAAAQPDGGFAYLIFSQKFGTLPDWGSSPASTPALTRSKLRLFENGLEIGPAHTVHATIRSQGRGRFSHWGNQSGSEESLRFAASDNSDPRSNGKKYTYCSVAGSVTPPPPPSVDTDPPTAPTGVSLRHSGITLTWKPSIDEVGVSSYTIYRNGVRVGTSTAAIFRDNNLHPGTHEYQIEAVDGAGNLSPKSEGVSVNLEGVTIGLP